MSMIGFVPVPIKVTRYWSFARFAEIVKLICSGPRRPGSCAIVIELLETAMLTSSLVPKMPHHRKVAVIHVSDQGDAHAHGNTSANRTGSGKFTSTPMPIF